MDTTTINFYESNATEISQRYEGAASPVERYFQTAFLPGSKILDIGAGRDAARLIANGYDAYATDPSPALLQASIALHPELRNRFAIASLPEIGSRLEIALNKHIEINNELFFVQDELARLQPQSSRLLLLRRVGLR